MITKVSPTVFGNYTAFLVFVVNIGNLLSFGRVIGKR